MCSEPLELARESRVLRPRDRSRSEGGERAALSKRFARFEAARQSRQRLECGGFSTAFAWGKVFVHY